MLDVLKFRKLENGYTIKYHVAVTLQMAGTWPSGFGGELYVTGKAQIKDAIAMLVEKYIGEDAQNAEGVL